MNSHEHQLEIKYINNQIYQLKNLGLSRKEITDGWHTFEELYYHRMMLTLALAKSHLEHSWKSKQHDDGTMFEGSFIVGFNTPVGQYSYHYGLEYWELFKDIKTLDKAPKYDGHQPKDIERLLSLLKENEK